MFGRKVLVLSLILVLCFGAGTALALDENPPSEQLLKLTARANATVERLVENAEATAARLDELYNSGKMPYHAYYSSTQAIANALVISTEAVLNPVKLMCAREGVSWRCEYEEVHIGPHTVYVDPIYVPGNAS
ncbi:MAG: hypothetical protein ACOX2K_06125 [Bacillota bacterium]|jgi:hypothetical protein